MRYGVFYYAKYEKFISKGGHSMTVEKFNTPTVSSKIGICGLPLRVDTYSLCSFGCTFAGFIIA